MQRLRLIIGAAVAILALGPSAAQVPQLISHQGKLLNSVGQPVPDGPYSMEFRFYDACTGGNVLLTDTHASVLTKDGIYNVLLGGGAVTPGVEGSLFSVFSNHAPVCLGTKVNGDSEMQPRQQIASAAYALRASTADAAVSAQTDVFGDGADGDVTMSGSTTLTRDMYYRNLTVPSGATLKPNGYRVFVSNQFQSSGVIDFSGNSAHGDGGGGSVHLGGAGLHTGSLPGSATAPDGAPAQSGGTPNGAPGFPGTPGANLVGTTAGVGGQGGASGNSGPGSQGQGATGGAGGAAGVIVASNQGVLRNASLSISVFDFGLAVPLRGGGNAGSGASGATGGAAGGNRGADSNPGGGAGSNGGTIMIAARQLINQGAISARGGNGGQGGVGSGSCGPVGCSGGGGGGGGASGGLVVLIYHSIVLGTVDVGKGLGGVSGLGGCGCPAGQNGTSGSDGTVVQIQMP